MINAARNFLISLNNLLQLHLKLSERAIQKTAEATGDFSGNKITDKTINVWKNSPQNSSNCSVESEIKITGFDKKIAEERLYFQKKAGNYWWSEISITLW